MRCAARLMATIVVGVGVAMLLTYPLAAAGAENPASIDLLTLRRIDEHGDARLAVDIPKLQAMLTATSGGKVRLVVPLNVAERVELDLERFEVLAPEARFIRVENGRETLVDPPRMVFLRGPIAGEPGSHAYLALNASGGGGGGGGGGGSITRADGITFKISTDYDEVGRSAGLIVRRMEAVGGKDSADAPIPCGTPDTAAPNRRAIPAAPGAAGASGGAGGTTNPEARGPRALVLAIDTDQSFSRMFPSDAQAQEYAVQLVGAVSDIYLRELNFRIVLAQVRTWPFGGEPFSATDLGGFRTWWLTSNPPPPPGIQFVHMLSGRRDLSYGGVAYLTDACSGFAFGINGFLLGDFPSPVTAPNLGNWDVLVVSHEIGHNLGSPHTWNYSPAIDGCTSGTFERGTIMSYCHTRPGGLLNVDMRMHATVAAFIAAEHAAALCLWHDCNGNGIDDAIEVIKTLGLDSNGNGIPDPCEDCNANGILDPLEIVNGAADINANGVLDSCEDDCNANGLPDQWEIDQGAQQDVNGNGRPDACEPDCNRNGTADFIDILLGNETDLDRNSIPDSCQDCNNNGVVDWIDLDRQFNWFVGQAAPLTSVREYHEASGVLVGESGAAAIDGAYDLCFGPDHQLYVASFGNGRIVRINVDTGASSSFVPAGVGGLLSPSALAFGPDGNLYVSSQGTNSVLRYHGQTGAPMGVFVPAGSGGMTMPWGLTFDPAGRLWVACGDNRLRRYLPNGAADPILVLIPPNALSDPRDLVYLPTASGGGSGELLVTNRGGNSISRFNTSGGFLGKFNDSYPLTAPWGIVIGPNGNVYVARTTSDVRVIEYDRLSGRYIRSFIRGDSALTAPTAFAIRPASPDDANGNRIPDVCENIGCIGDVTGNHVVDIDDLALVIISWGPSGGPADITGDGIVNIDDLVAVITHWGACP